MLLLAKHALVIQFVLHVLMKLILFPTSKLVWRLINVVMFRSPFVILNASNFSMVFVILAKKDSLELLIWKSLLIYIVYQMSNAKQFIMEKYKENFVSLNAFLVTMKMKNMFAKLVIFLIILK